MRESSEVSGRVILLGDVGTFEGVTLDETEKLHNLRIGASPQPARELKLNRAQVKSRLYNAGLELNEYDLEIPEKVTIRSRATVVTGKEIAEAGAEYLRANLPVVVKNFTVSIKGYPEDVVLPAEGAVELRPVLDVRPERVGITGYRVEVVQGGVVKRIISLQSYLNVGLEAAVAVRQIEAGETFSEGDIRMEQRPVADLRAATLFAPNQIVGKRARRRLSEGEVITANAVEVINDVNTGDAVQLIVRSGGIEVSTSGKALEKGLRGDTIRVMNLGARKIVNGVIIDSKTVEVLVNQ
ncbi:MAG: flagellar basal body P-ring formation chaperone FlgA [bacterium]